jgi:hypothetical protein
MSRTLLMMKVADLKQENCKLRYQLATIIAQQKIVKQHEATQASRRKRIVT